MGAEPEGSGVVLVGIPKYGLEGFLRTHTVCLEAGRTLPLSTAGDRSRRLLL